MLLFGNRGGNQADAIMKGIIPFTDDGIGNCHGSQIGNRNSFEKPYIQYFQPIRIRKSKLSESNHRQTSEEVTISDSGLLRRSSYR
jgi:hypothetical protein